MFPDEADDCEAEAALSGLLRRAREGDDSALGTLLEAYRDRLRAHSVRELQPGLDARVDASDIVQRTCLSAVMHFADFDGDGAAQFAAWLMQIHRRNLIDEVRKHTATQKRDAAAEYAGDPQLVIAGVASRRSTPSQMAMREDRRRALEMCLARLPEAQAAVVRMKHLDGVKLREIARRIGRSEEAVAGLLRRGLRTLRRELDE